jgi:hypothetical protein
MQYCNRPASPASADAAKENDADSWTPMQNWLLAQRRAGKSVLVIHHSGKSGAQRGTSRREDTLDTARYRKE